MWLVTPVLGLEFGPHDCAFSHQVISPGLPLLVLCLFVESIWHSVQAGIELAVQLMMTLNSSASPGLQLKMYTAIPSVCDAVDQAQLHTCWTNTLPMMPQPQPLMTFLCRVSLNDRVPWHTPVFLALEWQRQELELQMEGQLVLHI